MIGPLAHLVPRRLAERVSVAIFVAGLSFVAQAEHCVQGTLCYPDPADVCGPVGPVWCGGDDGTGAPQPPFTIEIAHMRDNPYPVTCGVSDKAQMLRSLSFDMLAFVRQNNYQDWYGEGAYQLPLNEIQFRMRYSDGSDVYLYGAANYAPGQYDPSVLAAPISNYWIVTNGYFAQVPFAGVWLGPDEAGHVVGTIHEGYSDYLQPNVQLPLCFKVPS